jgi:hypothetical protein
MSAFGGEEADAPPTAKMSDFDPGCVRKPFRQLADEMPASVLAANEPPEGSTR